MAPSANSILRVLVKRGILKELPSPSTTASVAPSPIAGLARLGLVDELEAMNAVAEEARLEVVDLGHPNLKGKLVPHEFSRKLSKDFCFEKRVVAIWYDGTTPVIAMANPLDFETRKTVEFALGHHVKMMIASEAAILRVLKGVYSSVETEIEELGDLEPAANVEVVSSVEDVDDEQDPTKLPIVKLANKIICDSVQAGASDIHLEPASHNLEVRYRVDGVMRTLIEVPRKLQSHLLSRFKLLAGMDIAERRRPQDGRFRVRVGKESVDIRASAVPTSYGEKLVFRLLRSEDTAISFSSIGFSPDLEARVKRALDLPGKMVIVTGPTGSGKTTTLYACLTYLNNGSNNIETVEDPIEYRVPGINQIQINQAIGITFASALRSVLRQDPDVVMVGEIRDEETVSMAFQAAQTGHVVLTSLHTIDAPSTMTRLQTMGADPHVISSSTAGIMAQRLIRKLCVHCRVPASEDYIAAVAAECRVPLPDDATIMQSVGCEECERSGYRGRRAIFSYLEFDEAVCRLVAQGAPPMEVAKEAEKGGFKDLPRSAFEAFCSGVTSFEEVRGYVSSLSVKTVAAVPPATREAERRSAASMKQPQGMRRDKILLVEDDPDTRHVLAMILAREQFEVFEATNGMEGLDLVYSQQPDIVLCDLMMPVMDGKEFLSKMRRNGQTKNVPVIILTAVDTEQNEVELLTLGATDFVSKTSSAKVMISRIERILRSKVE